MPIPSNPASGASIKKLSRHGRWPGLMVFAIIALLYPGPGIALDPARSLTQALHRIWQTQQGLPEPTIYSIRQTTDGYLWLGTQTGLVRFDGVRFTAVREVGGVSLEKLWIHDLLADHDHGLWIATDHSGLIHLRGNAIKRFTTIDGLPSDSIRCLLLDRDGTLWIGTDKGLASLANGKVIRVGLENVLANQDIKALCQTDDGTIAIGNDSSQFITLNDSKIKSHRLTSVPSSTSVRALLSAGDGVIWVGTTSGLIRFQNGSEQRFTTDDGLADDSVTCLCQSNGNSLFSQDKERIQPGKRRRHRDFQYPPRRSFAKYSLHVVLRPRRMLLTGTKRRVNRFVDRRTFRSRHKGLPSNDTGPVFQDDAGTVWVGTLEPV